MLVVVLAAIVLLPGWYWQPFAMPLLADTASAARLGCSCRYIAGRDLASCDKDFTSGRSFMMLSENEEEKSVTAWVPLLSSQTATYRDGPACVLEPWEN